MRYCLALILVAVFSSSVCAERKNEIWTDTFKAMNFSATSRASFRRGCNPENSLSVTPQYKKLCPKLDVIPDEVIESAALPYLKQHLTEDVARQAIKFWSSDRGKSLTKKILREIETGMHDQLSESDLRALDQANKSEYGRALSAFASDREQSIAVARAMLNYEP